MSDATKRSLRTLFHALLAMVTVVPGILALLPNDLAARAAGIAAGVALVSRVLNAAEDRGLIPAWLKGTDGGEPVLEVSAPSEH